MGVHHERPRPAYRPTGPPSSGSAARATGSASVGSHERTRLGAVHGVRVRPGLGYPVGLGVTDTVTLGPCAWPWPPPPPGYHCAVSVGDERVQNTTTRVVDVLGETVGAHGIVARGPRIPDDHPHQPRGGQPMGCRRCDVPALVQALVLGSVPDEEPPDPDEVGRFRRLPDQQVPPPWPGQHREREDPEHVLRRVDLVRQDERADRQERQGRQPRRLGRAQHQPRDRGARQQERPGGQGVHGVARDVDADQREGVPRRAEVHPALTGERVEP